MSTVELTVIGKPECHLCDVASEVIAGVVDELATTEPEVVVSIEKLSILDDAGLNERYWEQIPVVLVNGEEHTHWHVDAARLRATIVGHSVVVDNSTVVELSAEEKD